MGLGRKFPEKFPKNFSAHLTIARFVANSLRTPDDIRIAGHYAQAQSRQEIPNVATKLPPSRRPPRLRVERSKDQTVRHDRSSGHEMTCMQFTRSCPGLASIPGTLGVETANGCIRLSNGIPIFGGGQPARQPRPPPGLRSRERRPDHDRHPLQTHGPTGIPSRQPHRR